MSLPPVNPDQHTFRSPKFKSVVKEAIEFFTQTPVHPLPPTTDFAGVGVYALYYRGPFEHYSHIARKNQQDCRQPIYNRQPVYRQPIYIGKAVPKGWRTGRTSDSDQDKRLYQRLKEHTHSINSVNNLEVHDFRCRFMILNGVETDLISAVESALIRTYKPLWNDEVDGFGNHAPGKGRYNQACSEWDVLHRGRVGPISSLAQSLSGRTSSPKSESIVAEISGAKACVVLPPPHRVGGRLWPWRLVLRTGLCCCLRGWLWGCGCLLALGRRLQRSYPESDP